MTSEVVARTQSGRRSPVCVCVVCLSAYRHSGWRCSPRSQPLKRLQAGTFKRITLSRFHHRCCPTPARKYKAATGRSKVTYRSFVSFRFVRSVTVSSIFPLFWIAHIPNTEGLFCLVRCSLHRLCLSLSPFRLCFIRSCVGSTAWHYPSWCAS